MTATLLFLPAHADDDWRWLRVAGEESSRAAKALPNPTTT